MGVETSIRFAEEIGRDLVEFRLRDEQRATVELKVTQAQSPHLAVAQTQSMQECQHGYADLGAVAAHVVEGEKSLIFCFRVPTAETLYRLLSQGVERRLRAARKALFASRGTETGATSMLTKRCSNSVARLRRARDQVSRFSSTGYCSDGWQASDAVYRL